MRNTSSDLIELYRRCIETDASRRPSFEEISNNLLLLYGNDEVDEVNEIH